MYDERCSLRSKLEDRETVCTFDRSPEGVLYNGLCCQSPSEVRASLPGPG